MSLTSYRNQNRAPISTTISLFIHDRRVTRPLTGTQKAEASLGLFAPTASLRIDHGKVKKLEIVLAPPTPRLQILAKRSGCEERFQKVRQCRLHHGHALARTTGGTGLVEYETSKLVSNILGPALLAPCHWSLQKALTLFAARTDFIPALNLRHI